MGKQAFYQILVHACLSMKTLQNLNKNLNS
jgi:hypothetical protein